MGITSLKSFSRSACSSDMELTAAHVLGKMLEPRDTPLLKHVETAPASWRLIFSTTCSQLSSLQVRIAILSCTCQPGSLHLSTPRRERLEPREELRPAATQRCSPLAAEEEQVVPEHMEQLPEVCLSLKLLGQLQLIFREVLAT